MEGATGYHLYASAITGSYESAIATVNDAVYSYKIDNLTNGTPYYFVVSAFYPAGESDVSNEISATPQIPLPGAPTLMSVIAGDTQVQMSWLPVNGSTGYAIFKSAESGAYHTEIATVSGSVYQYNAMELSNGTTYYFIVKALNIRGEPCL